MSKTLRLSESGRMAVVLDRGAGEPLVLLHGVGMQAAAWEPQVTVFAERYRVIAVNLPGHGGSTALPEGAMLPAFVAWLDEVLEGLDCGAVNLAGHSMGALIAGGYAVCHPAKVRRLAILNGVWKRTPEARAAVVARAAEIAQGKVDFENPLARWFGDGKATADGREKVGGWLQAVDLHGYAVAYRAFAEGDDVYADRWGEIACPALFLTGDGDPNSTPEMARAMAEAAPNGRAYIVEGHRHMVNLTAPDEVNRVLQAWLELPISAPARSEVRP